MKMHSMTRKGFLGCAALALTAVLSQGRGLAQVPATLIPPPGNVEIVRGYGVGVQIYHSAPSATDPTKFVWNFFAPEAALFNEEGKEIIHHFAGPSWQSRNGSLVVGALFAAPITPDRTAVPWLLLSGASHAGHGLLSKVTFIQRLDTVGGIAPATPPSQAGLEARVPYTATYVFFNKEKSEERSSVSTVASLRIVADGGSGRRVNHAYALYSVRRLGAPVARGAFFLRRNIKSCGWIVHGLFTHQPVCKSSVRVAC